MANDPNEADWLRKAGRSKIVRTCLLFGCPLLVTLVLAGLQATGKIHLEEYLSEPPNKVEQRVVWQAFAALVLFQFLMVAIGVLQGWGGLRKARRLRQQSAP